jgi:Ser/Thr protein kinase RdoA (MazF antagonist)
MDPIAPSATQFFFQLTPERVLDAVEALGVRCTGRVLALNSLENRVYEVELDVDLPPDAGRWDPYRVVKFYRPGRWTKEQIQEEHSFLSECAAREIPVVPPIAFPEGSTLREVPGAGIWYAVFPKVGGRILDEMSEDELRQIGRLLARLHNVGATKEFKHRLRLSSESYGTANLEFLRNNRLLPASIEGHYLRVAELIIKTSEPWFREVPHQRIHGDCHIGNILWHARGCYIVDFDDSLTGPCVQDLWLLTPGRDEAAMKYRERIVEGYEMMRPFERADFRLVEPLRALRMIHFTTWIAKRYDDPAFKQIFVDYGSERYWREQLTALLEVGEALGVG